MKKAALALAFIAGLVSPAFAEPCLTFDSDATLRGKVGLHEAAGEKPYWLLHVNPPLCIDMPAGDDLGSPARDVREVHLYVKSGDDSALEKMSGQNVAVTGHLTTPHSAEHKRPAVLEVESVKKR